MSTRETILRYALELGGRAMRAVSGEAESRPLIEFFTTTPGLAAVHPPIPAAGAQPSWFSKLSAYIDPGRARFDLQHDEEPRLTVRTCPGIADLLGLGFIVPLWTDYALDLTPDGGEFTWQAARPEFQLKVHGATQLGTMPVDESLYMKCSVKLVNPWFVRTPPGYSCLLLSPFYHFDPRFSVLPGIVDTDVYHGCNVNTLWRKFSGTMVLEAGTPLLQVVPFRRADWGLEVREGQPDDAREIAAHHLRFNNSHKDRPGHYRKQRKAESPTKDPNGTKV